MSTSSFYVKEFEDGLRFALELRMDSLTIVRKEYWLGMGGNGADFEPDKHNLEELARVLNENVPEGETVSLYAQRIITP